MKFSIIASLCFFLANCAFAQFTKTFDAGRTFGMLMNEQDIIILPLNPGVSRIETNGDIKWSKYFVEPITSKRVTLLTDNMSINNEGDFTLYSKYYENRVNKIALTLLNKNGEIKWSKYIQVGLGDDNLERKMCSNVFFSNGRYYVIGKYFIKEENSEVLSCIVLDKDGNLLWHKELKRLTNTDRKVFIFGLKNGTFVVLEDREPLVNFTNLHFYDSNFEIIESIELKKHVKNVHLKNDQLLIQCAFAGSGAMNYPQLISLNNEFEINWAKSLLLNGSSSESSRIAYTDDHIVVKTRVGNDVFSLLNYDGEIENSWRLPNVVFGLDYGIYSSSKNIAYYASAFNLDDDYTTSFLTFHDAALNDSGCYLPEACVEIEDFDVEINTVPNPYTPVSLNIEIMDTGFTTRDDQHHSYDFCPDNFTPIAVPLFSSEDTLCIGEEVPLYNLQNVNAESVQWDLPGSTLENTADYEPPVFSYTEPGKYTITQTVEYAGCFSDYSVDLVIVPPVELALHTVALLCEEEDYLIDASAPFILEYLWLSDSSDLSSYLAEEEGNYTVEISDRHCTQSVDFNIEYFDYDLITVPLGADTSICLQRPLLFQPALDSQAAFFWSDNFSQLSRTISESGSYTLTTTLDGCSTSSAIHIVSEDCSAQIYIPTAFSPNQDGINDTFYPLGNFFEVLDFQIFDRWGNQVHGSKTSWDGRLLDKDLQSGIYVYSLEIINILLNEKEFLKGEVVLVK